MALLSTANTKKIRSAATAWSVKNAGWITSANGEVRAAPAADRISKIRLPRPRIRLATVSIPNSVPVKNGKSVVVNQPGLTNIDFDLKLDELCDHISH